jgi:hypothetical protein
MSRVNFRHRWPRQLLDVNQALTSVLPAGVFWLVVLFTTAPSPNLICHTAACTAVTSQVAGR